MESKLAINLIITIMLLYGVTAQIVLKLTQEAGTHITPQYEGIAYKANNHARKA